MPPDPIAIPASSLTHKTTTIYLVRHADIDTSGGADRSLNSAGQARALELARVLGKEKLAALYASEAHRTQQTVQPLAQSLGLNVQVIDAGAVDILVQHIRSNHTGQKVLVAGHSDTIPQIVTRFGGPQIPDLHEREFDRLFIVTTTKLVPASMHVGQIGVRIPERSTTSVLQLRYGPTSQ